MDREILEKWIRQYGQTAIHEWAAHIYGNKPQNTKKSERILKRILAQWNELEWTCPPQGSPAERRD